MHNTCRAKEALGLVGKTVLGFTGFVREWHGLEFVIDLLGDPGSPTDLHLVVVGDGPALGALKKRFQGLVAEGRAGIGGPRVAVLMPQTYMNDAGRSVGPARGSYKVPLDRVLVVHDEIDLPFGDVRVRLGGGLAGHNGLKSLKAQLGGADFHRVRVGVGRPDSTDPDIVAGYVLGKWQQPRGEVAELVDRARDAAERVVVPE